MWPMLTGIGPILGDGVVGSFVAAEGSIPWFYQNGKTGTRNQAGLETVSLTLDDSPVLMTPSAPVAVLVDSSTASSAEAITIAFHGRPATRFFGTHTAGKSTAVQPFKLDDGAELYLTTAIDADRAGKQYPDGFTPDQVFPSTTVMPPEGSDPVVQAAQTWLVANITPAAAPLPSPKLKAKRKKPESSSPAVPAAQPLVAASTPPAAAPAVAAPPAAAPVAVAAPAAAAPAAAAPLLLPLLLLPPPLLLAAAAPAAAAPTTVADVAPTVPSKPKAKRKKVVVHEGS